MKNRVITISREFGSGGRTIGKKVAEKPGMHHWNLGHSYRVPGSIIAEHKVIIFELTKAEAIEHE